MIGTMWLHVKTGHLYIVVGECWLEATNAPAVLYHRAGGVGPTWARDREEFLDGRFAQVSGVILEERARL